MRVSITFSILTFFAFVYETSGLAMNNGRSDEGPSQKFYDHETSPLLAMPNDLADEGLTPKFFDDNNLKDLSKLSIPRSRELEYIQKFIPKWDCFQIMHTIKDCEVIAKQFYLRPANERHRLSVYLEMDLKNLNGYHTTDYVFKCVSNIFHQLSKFDVHYDLEESLDNWFPILLYASSSGKNDLVKSLINEHASYNVRYPFENVKNLRHFAACNAARFGDLELLDWFIDNYEPIDVELIVSALEYREFIDKELQWSFGSAYKALELLYDKLGNDGFRAIIKEAYKSRKIDITTVLTVQVNGISLERLVFNRKY